MDLIVLTLLNGLSYGLLLFMLSAGLTLIFSLLGVLNFAHAAFYMLGAYVGYALVPAVGYWGALLVAPLLVGGLGAVVERWVLRPVHARGHVAELMVTFGLACVLVELVQLVWGRAPLDFRAPPPLDGPLLALVQQDGGWRMAWALGGQPLCAQAGASCAYFPATRGLIMALALLMWLGLWWTATRTRLGLMLRAALTHPQALACLGADVPRLFMGVFAAGCALAALAGVVGGSTFVTEPGMAAAVGSIVFVVIVVGGVGSLQGALLASLLIGLMQTVAVALGPRVALLAPLLPFALLVAVLAWRPAGLMAPRAA